MSLFFGRRDGDGSEFRSQWRAPNLCLLRSFLTIAVLFCISTFLSNRAWGQVQNPPASDSTQSAPDSGITPASPDAAPSDSSVQGDAGQFVFRKQVEEVVLHATVVDPQNNLVPNLGQSGFQVFEDGKLQQITSFHQEHVPVALGILIDNSGSMLPKRAGVNQAAINLIRSTDPHDEIFVVNFGRSTTWIRISQTMSRS